MDFFFSDNSPATTKLDEMDQLVPQTRISTVWCLVKWHNWNDLLLPYTDICCAKKKTAKIIGNNKNQNINIPFLWLQHYVKSYSIHASHEVVNVTGAAGRLVLRSC
jgi:hypothetical protein